MRERVLFFVFFILYFDSSLHVWPPAANCISEPGHVFAGNYIRREKHVVICWENSLVLRINIPACESRIWTHFCRYFTDHNLYRVNFWNLVAQSGYSLGMVALFNKFYGFYFLYIGGRWILCDLSTYMFYCSNAHRVLCRRSWCSIYVALNGIICIHVF